MTKHVYRLTIIMLIFLIWGGMGKSVQADSAHGKTFILLKEHPKARGELILLGEIAQIRGNNTYLIEQLKQIPLGRSPRPGYTKTLTPQIILYQLKKNHFDPENISFSGPDQCLVERQYRQITAKELEDFFIDQFYEKFSRDEFELESVKSRLPEIMKIPDGDIEFELSLSAPPTQEEENFALQIKQDGKLLRQVWISARLRYHTDILVAVRDIRRGQQITPADLTPQKQTVTRLDPDMIQDISQAAGLICRQFVQAGTVLSMKMLEKPLLIKKGAIIKIIAENQNLRVVSLGKAVANGHRGETIPAQNLSSQKNIYGEVIGENQIRITF